MDWIKQLNGVVEYIEDNLTAEISNDRIAELAGCSSYNFQRVFSYVAQITLSDYIRGRKLTLASQNLVSCDEKILDLAIKYGYSSQESFTRAFKSFHGVSPSEVRGNAVTLRTLPKVILEPTAQSFDVINYKIIEVPSFTVLGIKNRIKTSQAFDTVPELWGKANQNGNLERLIGLLSPGFPAGILGIASGGGWGSETYLDYIIGVRTDPDAFESGFEKFDYSAAKWVVVEANGDTGVAIAKAYEDFYGKWLPATRHQLADLPVIECYFPDNQQELWVAII